MNQRLFKKYSKLKMVKSDGHVVKIFAMSADHIVCHFANRGRLIEQTHTLEEFDKLLTKTKQIRKNVELIYESETDILGELF